MEEPGSARAPVKRDIPWTLVGFAVLALYALLIVVLNREEVDISFVFFSTRISKLVLILLCFGIGFVAGYLFDRWRVRRAGYLPRSPASSETPSSIRSGRS